MSAERIIYSLLSSAPGVTAIVSNRIYPLALPEGKALPAIVYDIVAQQERVPLSGVSTTRHITAHARVTAVFAANDYAALVGLFSAAKNACRLINGTVASIQNVTALIGAQGQDMFDAERQLCLRTFDVRLMFNES